jgi:hypothetical protein
MTLLKETLDTVEVMCLIADPGPAGIKGSWDRLEGILPSLQGRKFYGTYDFPDGPYRACVALRAEDEPETLGLQRRTIPGGLYLRRRLANWHEAPDRIRIAFGEMSGQVPPDGHRPRIEFYRRHDEVILYLPILA